MAAQLSDPLAHMSLSYRYQLSLDGFEKDIDLQAGTFTILFDTFCFCFVRPDKFLDLFHSRTKDVC